MSPYGVTGLQWVILISTLTFYVLHIYIYIYINNYLLSHYCCFLVILLKHDTGFAIFHFIIFSWFENNCSQLIMGAVACAWLAFHMFTLTKKKICNYVLYHYCCFLVTLLKHDTVWKKAKQQNPRHRWKLLNMVMYDHALYACAKQSLFELIPWWSKAWRSYKGQRYCMLCDQLHTVQINAMNIKWV